MEQKISKISKKRLWSVYVFVEVDVCRGRVFSRKTKQRDMKNQFVKEVHEYLYLDVTKMYKEGDMLYICMGKSENHMHELKRVVSIQIREYKRSGIQ